MKAELRIGRLDQFLLDRPHPLDGQIDICRIATDKVAPLSYAFSYTTMQNDSPKVQVGYLKNRG